MFFFRVPNVPEFMISLRDFNEIGDAFTRASQVYIILVAFLTLKPIYTQQFKQVLEY